MVQLDSPLKGTISPINDTYKVVFQSILPYGVNPNGGLLPYLQRDSIVKCKTHSLFGKKLKGYTCNDALHCCKFLLFYIYHFHMVLINEDEQYLVA